MPDMPTRAIPRVAALLALLVACGDPARLPADTPVILIVIDTLRADHLGCYGHPLQTSPHLDGLAQRAYVFEQNATQCNATFASLTSIMTGLYPATHGHYSPVAAGQVEGQAGGAPGAGLALAERLRAKGYWTAAVLSHPAFGRPAANQALGRGWDAFSELPQAASPDVRRRVAVRAHETNARVFTALERHATEAQGRPLFLFVHYFDPHTPYDPPVELRDRFLRAHLQAAGLGSRHDEIARLGAQQRERALNQYVLDGGPDARALRLAVLRSLYDAEIAHCDAQIGALLDRLERHGLLERALIVVMSDHGENMESDDVGHGPINFGHSRLFEGVVRTPLIVRLPGQTEGRRVSALTQNIDVLPTIVELMRLPAGAAMEGRSLLPLLHDPGASVHEQVFSEDSARVETAMKTAALKVIHQGDEAGDGPPWLVYRWPDDPDERRALDELPEDQRAALMRALAAFRTRPSAHDAQALDPESLDPIQLETLRELGYVK